ncbi:MAG: HD domain-containing protein [Pseudobutyrivibrio sp.]|nr:HD domain-containing protein [Pseudobutyrivibrio sp.]
MNSHRSRKDSWLRVLLVFIAVAVSWVLSYIAHYFDLPIYLDTVGSVSVAFVGGVFPAIMTAVTTEVMLMLSFNSNALYFTIVNAVIAVYASWYVREKKINKLRNVIIFILNASTLGGIFSGIIQWGLFHEPQNKSIALLINVVQVDSDLLRFIFFIIINIFLNIINLSVAVGIAMLCRKFIPKEIQLRIKNSGWRQRPLSTSQMKQMDKISDSRRSLRRRMSVMFILVSITSVFVMGWIGLHLYYNNAKEEMIDNAYDTVKAASYVIDPERISTFVKRGYSAVDYQETDDMLYYIWKSSTDMEYLYVVTIDKDYVTFVFDVDDRENSDGIAPYAPGEQVEIEDAFQPYMPSLLAGEEIEPIISNDKWSWLLTVYYPLYDSKGNCVCYIGTDASMSYIADYIGDFFIRIILVLSGFLVLIIATGLWTTGLYIAYPIDSMVMEVEKLIKAGSEQKDIDEAVRTMRTVDIHTDDEVEKLYKAICDMAASQAEQLRRLRYLSESTANMQDGLIITMADLVENRDSDTGAHIQKTAAYVKIIVEGLQRKGYYAEKINSKYISDVVRSAPLHDVGKINIPDRVLNKPGKLTDEEYEIIKTHTTAGRRIMEKAIDTVEGENYLKEARNMAAYHHERWDGKGYPEGLHGEAIPLSARIMAVADVFDALTSPRVYKPAFPLEQAVSMIQEGAGTQFDAKCVEVFIDSLDEVKVILRKYNEKM